MQRHHQKEEEEAVGGTCHTLGCPFQIWADGEEKAGQGDEESQVIIMQKPFTTTGGTGVRPGLPRLWARPTVVMERSNKGITTSSSVCGGW
jgi:hypothetical protein